MEYLDCQWLETPALVVLTPSLQVEIMEAYNVTRTFIAQLVLLQVNEKCISMGLSLFLNQKPQSN